MLVRHRLLCQSYVSILYMSCGQRLKPGRLTQKRWRSYHHGNLREALIRAALELIAGERDMRRDLRLAGGQCAALLAISAPPAAVSAFRRPRRVGWRMWRYAGFEQFAAALARAWDDGRPDEFIALDRLGMAYLGICPRPAGVSTRRCSKPRRSSRR